MQNKNIINKKRIAQFSKIMASVLLFLIVIHTIAVMVTSADVRALKEQLDLAGYPMRPEDIIPKSVPPSENAALEMNKVFGLLTLGSDVTYSPGTSKGNIADQYKKVITLKSKEPQQFLSQEQMNALDEAFHKPDFPRIFSLLTKATHKSNYQIERSYDDGPSLLLPELGHFRDISKLLDLKALMEVQKDQKNEAIRLIAENLRLANFLNKEPCLITQLVHQSLLSNILITIRQVSTLYTLDDSDMNILEPLLKVFTDSQPLIQSIHGERILFGQWAFEHYDLIAEENLKAFGSEYGYLKNYFSWYLFRPIFNYDHFNYLKVMQKATEYLKLDLNEAIVEDIDATVMNQKSPITLLTNILTPSIGKARLAFEEGISNIEMTKLAIACNNYRHKNGHYPETLQEMTMNTLDRCTGKPYLYFKKDNEIFIYTEFDQFSKTLELQTEGKNKSVFGVKVSINNSEDKLIK